MSSQPDSRRVRLCPSGSSILLGDGLVLVLDDRFVDDEPGWCLRDGRERVGRVTVGQALELSDRRLVRPLVAMTSALVCDLHARSLEPAGAELVTPAVVAAAKHRLIGELADGVAQLAPRRLILPGPAPGTIAGMWRPLLLTVALALGLAAGPAGAADPTVTLGVPSSMVFTQKTQMNGYLLVTCSPGLGGDAAIDYRLERGNAVAQGSATRTIVCDGSSHAYAVVLHTVGRAKLKQGAATVTASLGGPTLQASGSWATAIRHVR